MQDVDPSEGQATYGSPKRANPIDVHVGSRVRLRRMLMGLSQEKLGDKLGVTFQQVQKYEKGSTRIYASRMHQLSRILEVPIQFFYDEMNTAPPSAATNYADGFAEQDTEKTIMEFLNSREGVQLNRAFVKIEDAKVRRSVIELVRSLGGDADSGQEPYSED